VEPNAQSRPSKVATESNAAAREPELRFSREGILRDYRIAFQSREASLLGRKEVLTGKAKFGIFGDGKEVAQVAMARAFRRGDFRSGYYRDQTLLMALGRLRIDEFFAQLYADPDPGREPCSAGRQMNAHFSTPLLDGEGAWETHTASFNSSADLSPTAAQMPRLVGLAQASRLYRELPELAAAGGFSKGGNEVAWGTIGDAACAEGLFWESVNAAGVLGAPLLLSIWDDGYGISVPTALQITNGDLSTVLRGFQRRPGGDIGYDLYSVRGWDYAALCETYLNAAEVVRGQHVPAIVHVTELTQPQGHSTSGSHERYKSPERLAWEQDHDCLRRMRSWMVEKEITDPAELDRCQEEDRQLVREMQRLAWRRYREPVEAERREFLDLAGKLAAEPGLAEAAKKAGERLGRVPHPLRRDLLVAAQNLRVAAAGMDSAPVRQLTAWKRRLEDEGRQRYGEHLYAQGAGSALRVPRVEAAYRGNTPLVNGFEVLNRCFDAALERLPQLVAFGEDVGRLGDVNQGFSGLQARYGTTRVADTGIREATIIGQAIGLAMRGLRPIAEIQYLDYVLYALQILSDDLATLRWRTFGRQRAPVIVRTRGHRLEGIWHAGSPLGALIHLLRGMWLCVPRNMTQAAGMYNTLLRAEDPALVIEVLNGYRVKERPPENIAEFTVPLGVPEVLRQGNDLSLVTYGACCRVAEAAAELLARVGIEAEVIDVQTLLPLDRPGRIVESLRKTNRIVVLDEDVPGGASAYILQHVLEAQGGYEWLDSPPLTITSAAHRPAFGSDGDYFSKPSRERVFDAVYELVREADPGRLPALDG
jgi:pyruvate/2-oxoglutarate/acetoin dehydrogenase E1 component/TPP-dependent pyruvate/acetoin dehydrogenase alpha subunit